MKRFLFSCLLSLLVLPALAQSGRSAIRFRLSDGAPLTVAVDERYYNKRGTSLVIGDLPPGRHRIKVYRMAGTNGRHSNRAELIYEGRIRVAPQTYYQCVVDVYSGAVSLRSRPMEGDMNGYSQRDDRRQERESGRPRDTEFSHEDRPRQPEADRTPAPSYDNSNPRGNVITIRQSELDRLKDQVSRKITDSDKQKLMQEELREKSFSTGQVRQLLGWLTFESSRLEFAKWAFEQVTDPGNYRQLESEFTFAATKEEFREFLDR